MSNVVGFLANVGSDASLRYTAPSQLLRTLKAQPVLNAERETMYCALYMVKPPKKTPTKRNNRKHAPTVRH